MDITNVISALLSEMQRISSSETVVGKPIRVGDATIIPISKLGLGFGAGVADARGSRAQTTDGAMGGAGAGGGISVDPQAFIVVDKDGQAQLLSLQQSKESVLTRAIELLPQVVEKVADATANASSRLLDRAAPEPALPQAAVRTDKPGKTKS